MSSAKNLRNSDSSTSRCESVNEIARSGSAVYCIGKAATNGEGNSAISNNYDPAAAVARALNITGTISIVAATATATASISHSVTRSF